MMPVTYGAELASYALYRKCTSEHGEEARELEHRVSVYTNHQFASLIDLGKATMIGRTSMLVL